MSILLLFMHQRTCYPTTPSQNTVAPTDLDPYPFTSSPQTLLLLFSLLKKLLGSNVTNCSRYTTQVRYGPEAAWFTVGRIRGYRSSGGPEQGLHAAGQPEGSLCHRQPSNISCKQKTRKYKKTLPSCKELPPTIEVFLRVIAYDY